MTGKWKVRRSIWLGYWCAAPIDRDGPVPMFFPRFELALEHARSGGAFTDEGMDIWGLLFLQKARDKKRSEGGR